MFDTTVFGMLATMAMSGSIANSNGSPDPGFTLTVTPAEQSICTPADAVYGITVDSLCGYSDDVWMSATGTPAGTAVTFSVNPVTPPGTTQMIVTNTGGSAAGDYDIEIAGDAIFQVHTVTAGLTVATVSPGVVTLVTPSDGASVGVHPWLTWSSVTAARAFTVQVASDPAFATIVFEAVLTDNRALAGPLAPHAIYYWRVLAHNGCGTTVSAARSFWTVAPVLLVDDDDNNPDVRSLYASALEGVVFDVWDTNNSDFEPNELQLEPYSAVIWFTGAEFGGFAGPGPAGETSLRLWLDDGGCLFISSQDYFWDRGLTAFMADYLGVAGAVSDVAQTTVTGAGTVFGGLGPFPLVYPFNNYSDQVDPDATAETAFVGDVANAAVSKDGGVYRTAFLGFAAEAIVLDDRALMLQTMLEWCFELGPPRITLAVEPTEQSICTPASADYEITVGAQFGPSYPVIMSASGAPPGTIVSFSANPVFPPGTTQMTVSNTGGADAGDYDIEITGDAITDVRTVTARLVVANAVPEITLFEPPDGATDVSIAPTLQWCSTAGGGQAYTVQVASDPAFASIVFEAVVTDTSVRPDVPLGSEAVYHWRVQGHNACGAGGVTSAWSFTTVTLAPILLVDDDDNDPDVRSMYEAALGGLGLAANVWDTNNSDDEPTAAQLAPYEVVLWFTGDEFGGFSGPGPAGEASLAEWLDGGGCLFISSQDYFWDRGLTGFMAGYLGVADATSDVAQTSVTGVGSVFGALGVLPLSYPFANYSDIVQPDGTAQVAFVGDIGNAAVSKDGGVYRSAFLGFPAEAIAIGDRREVIQTMLDWCAGLSPSCPGDVDGDAVVAITDLLAVLAAWGDVGGPADVNGDGVVDVQDLLMVLANWGPC